MRHSKEIIALIGILSATLNIMEAKGFDIVGIYGNWNAHSKNHYAISGDMNIDNNTITWEQHGVVIYYKIHQYEDAIILKLYREIDCGDYVRLGPVELNEKGDFRESMEVAFYRSKEEALAPKSTKSSKPNEMEYPMEYPHGCSWGIYSR